jgi:23S rRNA (uracil1939-C5)-methyltransferase
MEYTLTLEQPLTLSFHPQDFVQSNAEVNRVMVTQALSLLAPKPHEHIVDLFCGVGNFSLAIAQQAGFVTGIEGVDTMVVRAQNNAQSNALENTHFMVKDLASETFGPRTIVNNPLFDTPRPIDAMVLDPPRSGAKEICQKIREFLPKRIVYVSCDSSTFARDAKILIEKGYHFAQLGLMDMFPQTAHIELMALFTLTSAKPTKSRVKRQLKLR